MATTTPILLDKPKTTEDMFNDLLTKVTGAFKNLNKLNSKQYKHINNKLDGIASVTQVDKVVSKLEDTKKSNDDKLDNVSTSVQKQINDNTNELNKGNQAILGNQQETQRKTYNSLKELSSDVLLSVSSGFKSAAIAGDMRIINMKHNINDKFFKFKTFVSKKFAVFSEKFSSLINGLSNLFNDPFQTLKNAVIGLLKSPLFWSAGLTAALTSIGLNPAAVQSWFKSVNKTGNRIIGLFKGLTKILSKTKLFKVISNIGTRIGNMFSKVKLNFLERTRGAFIKVDTFFNSWASKFKESRIGKWVSRVSNLITKFNLADKLAQLFTFIKESKIFKFVSNKLKPVVEIAASFVKNITSIFSKGGGIAKNPIIKVAKTIFNTVFKRLPFIGTAIQGITSLYEGVKSIFGEEAKGMSIGEKIWLFTKTSVGDFLKSFAELPSSIGDIFGWIFGKDHPVAKAMKGVGDALTSFAKSKIDFLIEGVETLFSLGYNMGGLAASIFSGDTTAMNEYFKDMADSAWKLVTIGFDRIVMDPIRLVTDLIKTAENVLGVEIIEPIKRFALGAWNTIKIGAENTFRWFDTTWVGIKKGSEVVATWFSETWTKFKEGGDVVIDWFKGTWSSIKEGADIVSNWFSKTWDTVSGNIVTFMGKAKKFLNPFIEFGEDVGNTIISFYNNAFKNATGLVGSIFSGNWEGVKTHFWGLLGSFTGYFTEMKDNVINLFTNISEQQWYKDYIQPIVNIFSPLRTFWDEMVGSSTSLIGYIFKGEWSKVGEEFGNITSIIKQTVSDVVDGAVAFFTNVSEQKWFKDYVQPVMDKLQPVFTFLETTYVNVDKFFKSMVENTGSLVSSIFNGDWNGIVASMTKGKDDIVNFVLGIPGSFKNLFTDISEQPWVKDIFTNIKNVFYTIKTFITDSLNSVLEYAENFIRGIAGIGNTVANLLFGEETKEEEQRRLQLEQIAKDKEVIEGYRQQIENNRNNEKALLEEMETLRKSIKNATADKGLFGIGLGAKTKKEVQDEIKQEIEELKKQYNRSAEESTRIQDKIDKKEAKIQEKMVSSVKVSKGNEQPITIAKPTFDDAKQPIIISKIQEYNTKYPSGVSQEDQKGMSDKVVLRSLTQSYLNDFDMTALETNEKIKQIAKENELKIPALSNGGIVEIHNNEAVVSDLESQRGEEWVEKLSEKINSIGNNEEVMQALVVISKMIKQVLSSQGNIKGLIGNINNNDSKLRDELVNFHNLSNRSLGI